MTTGKKFSQIQPSTANFAVGDFLVGVQGGTVDALFTRFQVDQELTANTDFYVRPDGSDSNNGLANTAGGAWLTLQHASDTLDNYELNGYTATIHIADGTYNGFTMGSGNISGRFVYTGNSVTPANVIISGANANGHIIEFSVPVRSLVEAVTMTGTGTETGIYIFGSETNVDLNLVSYNNCAICFTSITDASLILASGAFSITGNGTTAFNVRDGASCNTNGPTITLVGTPNFSARFIHVDSNSIFGNISTATFSGSATGARFLVGSGGVILTGTNDLNYFPGNAVGIISPGGQYDNFIGGSGSTTVAGLPSVTAVPAGQRNYVTDSTVSFNSSNVGLVVVGLGGFGVPVLSNGSNWVIG